MSQIKQLIRLKQQGYSLASGNRFRTFNVMDDCSREILCIEIATSISSLRAARTLVFHFATTVSTPFSDSWDWTFLIFVTN
ncbi:hypothetical protein [Sphingobacterium athyrii]|nr:hypothetical protein [Sphingobacterium athyrii]